MQRKAKIFMNNRSQAVRLPKDFQFQTQEVFIRREGSEVVLSPRPFSGVAGISQPCPQSGIEQGHDKTLQRRGVVTHAGAGGSAGDGARCGESDGSGIRVYEAGSIDEAVELAKVYSTDASPKFVNGVLSSIAEHILS